jgi:hypothetical protein
MSVQFVVYAISMYLPGPASGMVTRLFNVAEDESETVDVARDNAAMVEAMWAEVVRLNGTRRADADTADVEAAADPRRHGGAWVPWRD